MGLQLFDALDRDWAALVASSEGRAGMAHWRADPTLSGFPDLDSVVSRLRNGATPEQTNQILAALIRRADTDDLAARVVLQALVPGLVNVTKRLGKRRLDDDLQAQVVTEAIERIRHYPLTRRPRAIAANVVQDVLGRIYRIQDNDSSPPVDDVGSEEAPADPSVEVFELVEQALAAGRLGRCHAELLLSVAIGDDTLRDRAAREGVSYAAIHERWRRARNRLRAAATRTSSDHDPSMHRRRPELNEGKEDE
jgi:hypothetical protein